jgi:hypothetical protein
MQSGGIEFTYDLGLLLDKQTFDGVSADAHAEELLGSRARFVGCAGKLYTACFSTFAGRNLRLDDAWSDIRRGHRSLGGCSAKRSTKRGNADSIQDE